MISRKSILDWKVDYPWQLPEMVEQDLIICRAIVSIFSDPFLAKELAWKGGTALHKLYLMPQARYSEDIDLVHEESVSKKNFIQNMEAKLRDPDYLSDMETFLRPGTTFDPKSAWSNVRSRLVDAL